MKMWYEKLQKLKWEDGVIGVGLALVAVGVGINLKNKMTTKTAVEVKKNEVQSNSIVTIDVGGAVIQPGLYKLQSGDRVNGALIAAGGLAANADREWVESRLNKAELLKDGEKILIPTRTFENDKSQISNDQSKTHEASQKENSLINLNTASAEELDSLPGIGPAMASRIIDYREKNGGFKNIEEIKLVSGIGEKLYQKIKEEISI